MVARANVRGSAWPKVHSSPTTGLAERQGRSGLGLEAQRKAVEDFLNGGNWRLVAEFTEIESGKHSDRPALAKAFQACRLRRAKLVIAKLDRLSRDAHFLLGLEKAGVDFVAADMPTANRLTVGIMAMVADEERRLISKRTKEALAAARARGVQLGGNRGAIIGAAARETSALAASICTRKVNAASPQAQAQRVTRERGGSWSASRHRSWRAMPGSTLPNGL